MDFFTNLTSPMARLNRTLRVFAKARDSLVKQIEDFNQATTQKFEKIDDIMRKADLKKLRIEDDLHELDAARQDAEAVLTQLRTLLPSDH